MSADVLAKTVAAIHTAAMRKDGIGQCLRLEIACTHDSSLSVGPHPGFEDGMMVVVYDGNGTMTEMTFAAPSDCLPARQLAAALLAWADWASALPLPEPPPTC